MSKRWLAFGLGWPAITDGGLIIGGNHAAVLDRIEYREETSGESEIRPAEFVARRSRGR